MAGEVEFEEIRDNLELERWFRLAKSHQRRIHGHRHARVRIVREGGTLVSALDAHVAHPGPFVAADLLPYRTAEEPLSQRRAMDRCKIMRKARWLSKRPILLTNLERRYQESPVFQLFLESLKLNDHRLEGGGFGSRLKARLKIRNTDRRSD